MDSSHTQILPYDSTWTETYETEKKELERALGDAIVSIEHIGSTSVPGLAAKPIIDIAILIEHADDADKLLPLLERIGYVFDTKLHANTLTPERHFFRKGSPTNFHLSIAYADRGSFWKRQLAFRDYLRAHAEERDRYANLKLQLIQNDPTGGDAYITGKTNLINEMLDASGFVRWKPSVE